MNVYWAIPYKTVTFSEEKRQNQICFFRFSTNWRTMACVTSEMHKFTIKQEKNYNISICGLDTNIKSPCIMCVQYIGVFITSGGVQYTGGIS